MIVYTSRTGNIDYIVKELGLLSIELRPQLIIEQPYFLFTYTDGLGDTPEHVDEFLKNEINRINIRGVIVSGNVNFGMTFCKPADVISKKLTVPIIRKIDLRGSEKDLLVIKEQYKKIIEGENI